MGHTLKEGWKVEVGKERGGKGGVEIWEGKGDKENIEVGAQGRGEDRRGEGNEKGERGRE